jgi:N-acetylglucosaminyl-diphospho-decaprenol L-rhamnosyltransferase
MGSGQQAVILSVIVVTWNGKEFVRRCLSSVRDHLKAISYEMIVIDNASSDGTPDMIRNEFPDMRLVSNVENVGFGQGNNIGMRLAGGRFFLLLNSDARLIDDTPLRLIERLHRRPDVGVIGPTLRFEDGRLQASAHRFGSLGYMLLEELGLYKILSKGRAADILLGGYWDHSEEREADWLTGACMLVRREIFEETGGFDPSIFLYSEEVEWCHRIKKHGWEILFSPVGEVMHIGHASADLLLGADGRIDRCLIASDRLTRKLHGPIAGALAPWIRIVGALLKLSFFSLGRVRRRDESYAREVRLSCRNLLRHYVRRVCGRVNGTPRALIGGA